MNQSPFELSLEPAVHAKLEAEIMRRINASISDMTERSQMLEQYADQIEGLIGSPGASAPWPGSSELNDPLTMEQFLTSQAMVSGAMDRNPPVMVEATSQDDEENASVQESFIPLKLNEGGFRQAKSDIIFNALRYPVAIAYIGYKQTVRDEWEEIETDPKTGIEVGDEDQDPSVTYDDGYKSVPTVIADGLEVRCVDTPDFFLYPANHTDLQRANGCGERMFWSQDELLSGIDDLGLDEQSVFKLIAGGPTHDAGEGDGDRMQARNERQGVEEAEGSEGLYEVFQWYCKPPLMFEGDENGGEFLLPKRYRNRDLAVLCCPAAQVMLRLGISQHGHTRPYVPFRAWPVPNSFDGWCIPMILDSVQAEANANIQHTINCANMQINPAMKVQENMARRYENLQVKPGMLIPYQEKPSDIEPFTFAVNSSLGYETQQWLGTKAEKLITAGGFGSLQSKQRKAAEVQATSASASTKSDLILRNLNMGFEELWAHAAALLAENISDDGEDFLDEEDHAKRITPAMLKGKYVYRPVANGQNADPQSRVVVAEAKNHAADEYLQLKANAGTPIEVLKLKWHNTRAVLRDMGEHAPDAWIGELPSQEATQTPPGAPGAVPGAPPVPGMPAGMPQVPQMQGGGGDGA